MKKKIVLGIVFIVFSVTIGALYYTYTNDEHSIVYSLDDSIPNVEVSPTESVTSLPSDTQIIEEEEVVSDSEEDFLTIYVYGAINKCGIYKVQFGARVYEVIDLAGGLTENADIGYVNQARVLVDGESIFFPTVTEAKALPKQPTNLTQQDENREKQQTLININSASVEELMKLPGIGESRALDIISYRETNGLFISKEDIMKVTGIKNATFAKIEKLIIAN